ncbi:MAG: hypothetical protein IPO93_08010 [Actinobacteria bacterium]|nr:hypothetical protein [Actinomycetota bacterium]
MIRVSHVLPAIAVALGTVVLAPAAVARDFPLINYEGEHLVVSRWEVVTVEGTTKGLVAGTPLCLYRVELGDTDAQGNRLDICTSVNKDRTFRLHARLGITGGYFYQLLPTPVQPVNQRGLVIDVR